MVREINKELFCERLGCGTTWNSVTPETWETAESHEDSDVKHIQIWPVKPDGEPDRWAVVLLEKLGPRQLSPPGTRVQADLSRTFEIARRGEFIWLKK